MKDSERIVIGKLIKHYRDIQNISIDDLIENICSRKTLYKIEKGIGNVNIDCYFIFDAFIMD